MKKRILPFLYLLLLLAVKFNALAQNIVPGSADNFVTTWQVTSRDLGIIIPANTAEYTYNYQIYWEKTDDSNVYNRQTSLTGTAQIQFPSAGTYRVEIFGNFPHFYLGKEGDGNASKLSSVEQWGKMKWKSMNSTFKNAANLKYNAFDSPDLAEVKDLSWMFAGVGSFNSQLNNWDVSKVTDMNHMFYGCARFNNNSLNNWNVSQVTNMSYMFSGNIGFNQNLNSWNVSSVKDMSYMFEGAFVFNQPLDRWEVGNVTDMSSMFSDARNFNQNIGTWNVSKVTNMSRMFREAWQFNQVLNNWKVSNVTEMSSMFYYAKKFNSDISGWDVSKVTNMTSMFSHAPEFNQNVGNWNVSSVTSMNSMFDWAFVFNQPLENWDVSNVVDMTNMFRLARVFNKNLGNWDIRNVKLMGSMLDDCGMSMLNYDNTLIGWAKQADKTPSVSSRVNMGADGMRYCFSVAARNKLIQAHGWSIIGDTQNCTEIPIIKGDPNNFITTWTVGNEDKSITIPVTKIYSKDYNYHIYWEDVNNTAVNGMDAILTSSKKIDFPAPGTYRVEITGDFPQFSLIEYADEAPKLTSIEQWGTIKWESMEGAFNRAINMVSNASDKPDLSKVNNMKGMFLSAEKFNQDLNDWDVSSIINMHQLFFGAKEFNGKIDNWDVSRVTNMGGMFSGASLFNQPLDRWNVSAVTNMEGMFLNTKVFNQSLNSWNVSKVKNMSNMFNGAEIFNGQISDWDVSAVTNTVSMFVGARKFNQPLNQWKVGKVTNMGMMFFYAEAFNQDLNDWDVSKVTNMSSMFNSALKFNGKIDAWDVSSVNNMSNMFNTARVFNQDIGGWNVSNATNMSSMFSGAQSFNQDLKNWDVSKVTNMSYMLQWAPYNYSLGGWNVSSVTNMEKMLDVSGLSLENYDATLIGWASRSDLQSNVKLGAKRLKYCTAEEARNELINKWGWQVMEDEVGCPITPGSSKNFITTWTVSGTDLSIPLYKTSYLDYNYHLYWEKVDDPNIKGMEMDITEEKTLTFPTAGTYRLEIFGEYPHFYFEDNTPNALKLISIDQWGTNKWKSMLKTFQGAKNMEYKATDKPNLSVVENMNFMFYGAEMFNGNIGDWDVSKVTSMTSLFHGAIRFNTDLSNWKVSNVTKMGNMFTNASMFNGNISTWNVSKVTDMRFMFFGASVFNADVSDWDVSNVTNMGFMFNGASKFNINLSGWNVGKVTSMTNMFQMASLFDQPIGGWNVSNVTDMSAMFYNAEKFNQDLSTWNVSKVNKMVSMFAFTKVFNGNIKNWDVSNVTNMVNMFIAAEAFNQDISGWNVAKVTDMSSMFSEASAFNQNLGSWNISNVTIMKDMLNKSALSKDNYDATLIGWANRGGLKQNVKLGALDLVYCAGSQARETLVTNFQWNIVGDTQECLEIHGEDNFITTWQVSGSDLSITIPINPAYTTYNYHIYWEDALNSATNGVEANLTGSKTLTFPAAGTYRVEIAGDFPHFYLNNYSDAPKLLSVTQWGTGVWKSMEAAFYGAKNMKLNADDIPDLSEVSSMKEMFASATLFNGAIGGWNVSNVTNMHALFANAASFNGDISNWNVSSVTNMSNMFQGATVFNQSIGGWTVEKVTNMEAMFAKAKAFNKNIGSWNVSNVTNLKNMFSEATVFNQPLNNWNVAQVTNMSGMFNTALKFNQSLTDWKVNLVTDMSLMFAKTDDFNQDLSSWQTAALTDISGMFSQTRSFNGALNTWDVSAVTKMENVFNAATSFNKSVSAWNVANVSTMQAMFSGASNFDQSLATWDVRNVTNMAGMLDNSHLSRENYDATLTGWVRDNFVLKQNVPLGAAGLTFCEGGLSRSKLINDFGWVITGDSEDCPIVPGSTDNFITTWVVDNSDLTALVPVNPAHTYNYVVRWEKVGDASQTSVSMNITGDELLTFPSAGTYKVEIVGTFPQFYLNNNTSHKSKLVSIDQWGKSQWKAMNNSFYGASNLEYRATDIPDLSAVQDMSGMFRDNTIFNGNIGNWNVAAATNMNAMFKGATSFNQDIKNWDVSNVTNMGAMFENAELFNKDLADWSVAKVTTMNAMFQGARAFNGNIGNTWDVAEVVDMGAMFANAIVFNQSLGNWNISKVTNMQNMLDYSALSKANYDATLIGWASQPTLNNNVKLGAEGLTYCLGRNAHTDLENNYQWVISGDTENCPITPGTTENFVTTWRVSGTDLTVTIPTHTSSNYNYSIYWEKIGDQQVNGIKTDITGDGQLTFPSSGDYKVEIFGDFPQIDMGKAAYTDHSKLISINQWGTNKWKSMLKAFYGAVNMTYNASDNPDLAEVKSISEMFSGASSFNGAIGNWDVSNVEEMAMVFKDATQFNQSLSNWNVSNVKGMNYMFQGATSFNQDLDSWQVSNKMESMGGMFQGATSFNGLVQGWDVSNVKDMMYMFKDATSFNKDLDTWNITSKMHTINNMFEGATGFNGQLGAWNISAVTNLAEMFKNATSFNQDLNHWVTTGTKGTMKGVFEGATSFNGMLSNWDVSGVTEMGSMFKSAGAFNQSLANWNVSKVSSMNAMLDNSGLSKENYDATLVGWGSRTDLRQGVNLGAAGLLYCAGTTARNKLITQFKWVITGDTEDCIQPGNTDYFVTTWNIPASDLTVTIPVNNAGVFNYHISWQDVNTSTVNGKVTNLKDTYVINFPAAGTYKVEIAGDFPHFAIDSNHDGYKLVSVDQWGVNQWLSMKEAFKGASNMTLTATDKPDLSTVKDMSGMFSGASSFNGDIGSWNVSSVENMNHLFSGATQFNQNIANWDVSNVIDMSYMFQKATAFNQNLPWAGKTAKVTNMAYMFAEATSFNGIIDNWNVSTVNNMSHMFQKASAFNQSLTWNAGSVTNMSYMFSEATAFNGNIGNWDVSAVEDMSYMFQKAIAFNQNLAWNTSKVTNMASMFSEATLFNQDIGTWDVSKVQNMSNMFYRAGAFNGNIGEWKGKVANVKNMAGMFNEASLFNQTLADWDVSKVTDMKKMFSEATSFNQNVSGWNVNNVTEMDQMFRQATSFNQSLGNWNVRNVRSMDGMLDYADLSIANYEATLQGWVALGNLKHNVVLGAEGLKYCRAEVHRETLKNTYSWQILGDIQSCTDNFVTTWQIPAGNLSLTIPVNSAYTYNYDIYWEKVGDLNINGRMPANQGAATITFPSAGDYRVGIIGAFPHFYLNGNADADKLKSIDQWGTIEWNSMNNAFKGAVNMVYKATDKPDLSDVVDMSGMFQDAKAFNGDIASWNVSNIDNMSAMFAGALAFNRSLSNWDVTKVKDMSGMFQNATLFNQTLAWGNKTGVVTHMNNMFSGASAFNKPVSGWDVSKVENMSGMFQHATSFDQELDSWSVAAVKDMTDMFSGASSFNHALNGWNVSAVKNMSGMFQDATSFNQSLSNWNVTVVTHMTNMFSDAVSFNQSLGMWQIVATTDMSGMLDRSALSLANYDATLSGWKSFNDSQTTPITGITLGAAGLDYCSAKLDRDVLVDNNTGGYNWTINGDKESCNMRFITTWTVAAGDTKITVPANTSDYTYSYSINWEDVSNPSNQGAIANATGAELIDFVNPGTYRVEIHGTFPHFYLNGHADAPKLVSIDQWGESDWKSMKNAFKGAVNMTYNTIDIPDLSGVTDMSGMFAGASSFNGAIGGWDVSDAKDMTSMFEGASSFNQNLNSWNVLQVENMSAMFKGATAFNGIIGNWKVNNVTDMSAMFNGAKAFNRALGNWTVDKVTTLESTFAGAETFNQDLSSWRTPVAITLKDMFSGAKLFNHPVKDWDVALVNNMEGMFNHAEAFNQSLATWSVAAVTDMANMLSHSGLSMANYDATLIGWASQSLKPNVALGADGLQYCQSAEQRTILMGSPLSWNITGDTEGCSTNFVTTWTVNAADLNITIPANTADYTYNYSVYWEKTDDVNSKGSVNDAEDAVVLTFPAAGTYKVSISGEYPHFYLNNVQSNAAKLSSIEQWGNIQWKSMHKAFQGAKNMVYGTATTIGAPDLSLVKDMSFMFAGASKFNGSIGSWNVSAVEDMNNMFNGARLFNQPLNNWDVSQVKNMCFMFNSAAAFNQDLAWGVKTAHVTNMSSMFYDAVAFNGNIENWDVSNVLSMDGMFQGASAFNRDLDSWNVSKVKNMSEMFSKATAFNGQIKNWVVSAVENMDAMFSEASAFNQDISGWDVGNVIDMDHMFSKATSFNQSLGNWNVGKVLDMEGMLDYSALSMANYDATLIGWATKTLKNGVILGAEGLKYCQSENDRTAIMTNFSWTIKGDSKGCADNFITTWKVDAGNSTITIPVSANASYTYNYDIYWENTGNTSQKGIVNDVQGNGVITVPAPGTYKVSITGEFPAIYLNGGTEAANLLSIDQWGTIKWQTMESAFKGASDMEYAATDKPDLAQVKNMSAMFSGATSFNGSIDGWNVAQVQNMSDMFNGATLFDQELNSWNVSNVTNMSNMFKAAGSFNGNIKNWRVNKVANMAQMFADAIKFNQSLASWNISNVSDMTGMLDRTALSMDNYDNTLIGWGALSSVKRNVILGADQLNYCRGQVARAMLISAFSWDIVGDNQNCPELVITAVAGNKIYGQDDPELAYNATGFVNGEDESILNGALGRVAGENVATYPINLGTLTAPNYNITFNTADFTINPAGLKVVVTPGQTKVYGTSDPIYKYSVTGFVKGENESLMQGQLTRAAGNNVGDYNIEIGTLQANNYTISEYTGAIFKITPAPLKIVANPGQFKTYGQTDPVLTYTSTGLIPGDDPNDASVISGALSRVQGEAVRKYAINKGTLVAPNYSISFTGSDFEIKPAGLIVTVDPNQKKMYGKADPVLSYTATGFVLGEDKTVLKGALKRTTGEIVGLYPVNQGTLAADNYTITFHTDNFEITKAGLEVVADPNQSKVYGENDPDEYTYVATGFVRGDNYNVLTGKLGRVTGNNVGSYDINQGTLDAANYDINFTKDVFEITPAELTVIATEGQHKTYGDTDPVFVYTASGFVAGENQSVITGSLSRVSGEAVRVYAITQGSLTAPNYTINYIEAGFEIKAKELIVDAKPGQSKVYGTADPVLDYDVTNFAFNEDKTIMRGALSRLEGEERGMYPMNRGTLSAPNYTIKFNSADFEITPATLTVTPKAGQHKIYGNPDPELMYDITGFVTADDASIVEGALSRKSGENVGNYPITIGTLSAPNYVLTVLNEVFSIQTKELKIIADSGQHKTYGDQPDPELTYTTEGLVWGDRLTGELARQSGENVGKYDIERGTLDLANNSSNYLVQFVGNKFTINPALLTITPEANQQKVYGERDPIELLYTADGFKNGEDLWIMTGTLARASGEQVGLYKITQGTLSSGSNYTMQLKDEDFEIKKAILRVKAKDVEVCQDEPLPLTYEIESADWVNGDNESVLTAKPKVSGPSTGSSVAGVFDLEVHSAAADNYDFNYQKGRLEVYAAPQPTIVKVSEAEPVVGSVVILKAGGNANSTYEWTWEGGTGVATDEEVSILVSKPEITVSLTETTANGCSATVTYLIKARGGIEILVPNNFITPNGDGKNDVWIVKNLQYFSNTYLTIIDRSGKKVYETPNYQSDWGGVSSSGEILGEGTYYYLLEVEGHVLKGFITIIR
ncbi:BspA family leucine-rich repeat surface protein [Pseudopedobacter beijingensis]|uniref:BspA family leucine-rich repeat surface protein n=1 Tax=Pseudopedobacter beijingensis TaxID=1207056 RepID=A0ABW4I9Q1_9SPHI